MQPNRMPPRDQEALALPVNALRALAEGNARNDFERRAVNDLQAAGASNAAAMRRAGLAYIPDERMRDGVVATFSVAENLMLMDHARPADRRHGFLRLKAIRRHCRSLVDDSPSRPRPQLGSDRRGTTPSTGAT